MIKENIGGHNEKKIERFFSILFFPVLILLHPVLVAVLIKKYYVDVPYWDQWDFVTDLDRLFSGRLELSFLFRLQNEHRLFFPRIILLILSRISHWDIGWELFMSYLITCGILFLLIYQLRRFYPQMPRIFFAYTVVLFFFFSLFDESTAQLVLGVAHSNFSWGVGRFNFLESPRSM